MTIYILFYLLIGVLSGSVDFFIEGRVERTRKIRKLAKDFQTRYDLHSFEAQEIMASRLIHEWSWFKFFVSDAWWLLLFHVSIWPIVWFYYIKISIKKSSLAKKFIEIKNTKKQKKKEKSKSKCLKLLRSQLVADGLLKDSEVPNTAISRTRMTGNIELGLSKVDV